jgi:ABC-2 type transport system permease protein
MAAGSTNWKKFLWILLERIPDMENTAAIRPTAQKLAGIKNIFTHESQLWWGTRRWWIQAIIGGIGMNILLAFFFFVMPPILEAAGEEIDLLTGGAQMFFGLGFMVLSIDVIILTLDTVLGEKQNGTAEWVLSKPVSRSAFILAKLAAHTIPVMVLLVALPSAIAYGLFLIKGVPVPSTFLPAVGLMGLHTFFYLVLTIAGGVFIDNRNTLLAITLGSALGGVLLANLITPFVMWTPWPLAAIASGLVAGAEEALPSMLYLPVVFTGLWSIVGILAALMGFNRVELG